MALKEFDSDTIAAISSAVGEGGIGVVRISGKDAVLIADKVFESRSGRSLGGQKSWTAQIGHIIDGKDPASPKMIDEAVALVMRAPKSYTAEDIVEFSVHGGSAVLGATLELLISSGARPAQKGEFTKRAFLNGRIDLVQAESVLDIVSAKTEISRQWAAERLEGTLTRKAQAFKQELTEVLTHLEAAIDFPDDFPDTESLSDAAGRTESVVLELRELLRFADLGLIAKNGLKVVIAGRPNVGKSSLMNTLARENRVIVTPFPGTTRDVIEEEIQIRGFPVRLWDTAGIQDTEHPIEKEGIERAKLAVKDADLVLFVVDGSQPLSEEDTELLRGLENKSILLVINKADLSSRIDLKSLEHVLSKESIVHSSCVGKPGVYELEEKIFSLITKGMICTSTDTVVGTIRQKEALEKCLESAEAAAQACRTALSPELIAVDVRHALDSLGSLVGELVTDELLETLFSRFCIGK